MSDRHDSRAESAAASGWRVLLVHPESIQPVTLPSGSELPIGPAALIRAGRDGGLEVEAAQGGPVVLLNDVQFSGSSVLRAGDQVRSGELVALVQGSSAPPAEKGRHVWGPEHFLLRVSEELVTASARGEGGGLFLAQAARADGTSRVSLAEALGTGGGAGVVMGELGPDTLQLWADARALPNVRARLEALQAEGTLARFGLATYPEDAFSCDGLIDRALRRMWSVEGAQDELLVQDPMMVRLQGLMERVAAEDAPVLLVGEAGVGKTRWALQLHQRSGRRTFPFTRVSCPRTDADGLAALLKEFGGGRGTIVLEQLEALDERAQQVLVDAWPTDARIIATLEPAHPIDPASVLIPELAQRLARITLTLPALRDRPSEVIPLAMQALQQARAALGRARRTLTAEARRALQDYGWPGNVRELRNAVRLAALVAESDEVRLENLPAAVQRERNMELEIGADLRTALKATEKDALLKVLARTRWNVTAAARELGLPRRTVVYRMSRLGLKRPAH